MEGVAVSTSATTSNTQSKRQTKAVPQLAHCPLTARKGVSTPAEVGFYAKKGCVYAHHSYLSLWHPSQQSRGHECLLVQVEKAWRTSLEFAGT